MSIGSVLIGLQASREDGRGVTSEEFLAPLRILAGEVAATRADGGNWASGMVYFAVVRYSDFDHIDNSIDAGAQSEQFFEAIVEAFQATARFLDQRSPEITDSMRALGLLLQLFVDVRMDQDQMELEVPPELLASCGRHKLKMFLISNDIAVGELLEANQNPAEG
jgi:hypothetical protein